MEAEQREVEQPGGDEAADGAEAPPSRPVRHEDVVARVQELLTKYPNVGSRQLYDVAVRLRPDLEEAGFRSFHARYVLPLKRQQARAEGRPARPRTPRKTAGTRRRGAASAAAEAPAPETAAASDPRFRVRVREVLLRLARQVALAESRADLVDALAGVETHVDEIVAALTPAE